MDKKLICFSIALVISVSLFSYKHIQDFSQTGFNWFDVPKAEEIYLTEYGKSVSTNSEFTIYSSKNGSCTIDYCKFNKSIDLLRGTNKIQLNTDDCDKENTVKIVCGNLNNRFTFNKSEKLSAKDSLEFTDLNIERKGGYVLLNFSGKISLENSGVRSFEILINNNTVLRPSYVFSGENNFSFSEKIKFPLPGEIAVRALGQEIKKDIKTSSMRFELAGYIVLIFSILLSWLIYKKSNMPALIFILLLFLSVAGLETIHFRAAKTFGLGEWIVPLVSVVLTVSVYLNKIKISKINLRLEKSLINEILVFTILYLLFVLALKTFIGPYDTWWPYYARHTEMTYQYQTAFYQDELSYLGRPATYPTAFFEFGAEFTGLLGAQSFYDVQFLLHAILIVFYCISSYLLFLKFERKQRIIAVLLYSTMSFTLITTVIGTLHVFSFILLNIATLFYNTDRLRKLSPFALALALASHPITIFLFPFYVYATNKFDLGWRNLRPLCSVFFAGILISLVFYLPIFYNYGLPHSIESKTWGFLLTYGFAGLMSDFRFGLPLAILAMAVGLSNKKFRVPSIILLSILLFYSTIAYRVNMFGSIILSSLFVLVFKDYLKNKFVTWFIMALLASSSIFITVIYSGTASWCTWGSVKPFCTLPMDYLRVHTSTQDSVAINPEFGHLEAFLGERKVLADLYVEYANQKKFTAEDLFYHESNSSHLNDYNITWMVLDNIGKERDLPDKDRVYDNSFIRIYRQY